MWIVKNQLGRRNLGRFGREDDDGLIRGGGRFEAVALPVARRQSGGDPIEMADQPLVGDVGQAFGDSGRRFQNPQIRA